MSSTVLSAHRLLLLLVLSIISTVSMTQDTPKPTTRRDRIEFFARAVQTGDITATKSLVDEIFAINSELPDIANKTLKDRMVRAELKFNAKQHRVISAEQVANGINHLVSQLGTPDYTATSAAQIMQLRSRLLAQFPALLNSTQHAQQLAEGTFSPAQALLLEMIMLRQKAFNPEYQVPPTQALPNQPHHTANERSQALEKFRNNPKAAEVKNAIASRASQMTSDDAERLGHEVLDHCGVDR